MERIETQAKLWRWQSATAPGAWHFFTIEGEAADAIRVAAMTGQWLDKGKGGFGSAKVRATIGGTAWQTSVFPQSGSGGWVLPVKKAVRVAEGIAEGDIVPLRIEL
ncbi:MAG: DUF1905 domain-containing protein [Novosphingobium sp.]|nr:DUF1905 domain-containing protein [Novosphingobium sp.]